MLMPATGAAPLRTWKATAFVPTPARRQPTNPDTPIHGPYPVLAERLRELFGQVSLRVVERRTGVNYNTIDLLLDGRRSSFESLVKIAKAYKINPNDLLRLADYETVEDFDIAARVGKGADIIQEAPTAGPTYRLAPGFLPVPEHFAHLDAEAREDVAEDLEAAVERALKRQRKRGGTIGFGKDRYDSDPDGSASGAQQDPHAPGDPAAGETGS